MNPPLSLSSSSAHSSSTPPSETESPSPEDQDITDQEWELRTGRGIYVLQETLPQFFDVGLVTVVDKATGAPKPTSSTSSFHLPLLDLPGLASTSSSKLHIPSLVGGDKADHSVVDELDALEQQEEEPVYSPNVSLEYTPPVTLPPPFPKTFKVEGLSLYLASSALIRHAMNALYSDLTVTLTNVSIRNTPPPPPPSGSGSQFSSLHASPLESVPPSPSLHQNNLENPPGEYMTPSRRKERKLNREKHLFIRQLVTGVTRVGGKESEWEVESVYTFSPVSGLIWKHTVNSIHPAPHLAVYDSLKSSLGKVFGFGHPAGPSGAATAGAVSQDQYSGARQAGI